jgi:hypothetical protein
MEVWILLGLALVACGVGVVSRLRRSGRRRSDRETENIYPLW